MYRYVACSLMDMCRLHTTIPCDTICPFVYIYNILHIPESISCVCACMYIYIYTYLYTHGEEREREREIQRVIAVYCASWNFVGFYSHILGAATRLQSNWRGHAERGGPQLQCGTMHLWWHQNDLRDFWVYPIIYLRWWDIIQLYIGYILITIITNFSMMIYTQLYTEITSRTTPNYSHLSENFLSEFPEIISDNWEYAW